MSSTYKKGQQQLRSPESLAKMWEKVLEFGRMYPISAHEREAFLGCDFQYAKPNNIVRRKERR